MPIGVVGKPIVLTSPVLLKDIQNAVMFKCGFISEQLIEPRVVSRELRNFTRLGHMTIEIQICKVKQPFFGDTSALSGRWWDRYRYYGRLRSTTSKYCDTKIKINKKYSLVFDGNERLVPTLFLRDKAVIQFYCRT